jgi:hypothetical protein
MNGKGEGGQMVRQDWIHKEYSTMQIICRLLLRRGPHTSDNLETMPAFITVTALF